MYQKQENIQKLKVQVVGDKHVGKSSFMQRIADDSFTETYGSVVCTDFMSVEVVVKNTTWHLTFHDYRPNFSFSEEKSGFREMDAVIIVFDVTNRTSFDNIKKWRERVLIDRPVFLVANKSDLKGQVQVEPSELEVLSKDIKYCLGTEYLSCKSLGKSSDIIRAEIVKKIIQTKAHHFSQTANNAEGKYIIELETIWKDPIFKTEKHKITAVLNDYTKNYSFFYRFFTGHSDRKHIEEVNAISILSKNKEPKQVIDELKKLKSTEQDIKTLIDFLENKIMYDLPNDNSSQFGMI